MKYNPTLLYQDVSHSQVHYRSSERGVALIVVLLFLILIMLAGVMAVRQSNTDLKTATADQINTVLLQSSDSANEKLEAAINGSPTSDAYRDALSVSGVFGHFLLNPDNTGNEFIYCYNPRNINYLLNSATVYKSDGGKLYANGGVCDYNKPEDYTSDRQTVMTQMNITTTPTTANTEAFSHVTLGKETENRSSRKQRFDIYSTSALPSYNAPDGCFGETPTDTATATAASLALDCLHTKNTPSKQLYTQADLENMSSSTKCIPFGVGGATGLCTLASSSSTPASP